MNNDSSSAAKSTEVEIKTPEVNVEYANVSSEEDSQKEKVTRMWSFFSGEWERISWESSPYVKYDYYLLFFVIRKQRKRKRRRLKKKRKVKRTRSYWELTMRRLKESLLPLRSRCPLLRRKHLWQFSFRLVSGFSQSLSELRSCVYLIWIVWTINVHIPVPFKYF